MGKVFCNLNNGWSCLELQHLPACRTLKTSSNTQRTMKTNARCTKTEDPPHTPSDEHKLAPLMSAIVGYVTASPPSPSFSALVEKRKKTFIRQFLRPGYNQLWQRCEQGVLRWQLLLAVRIQPDAAPDEVTPVHHCLGSEHTCRCSGMCVCARAQMCM